MSVQPGRGDALYSDDAAARPTRPHATAPPINNLAIQGLSLPTPAKKAIVDETSARAAVTEITAEGVITTDMDGHAMNSEPRRAPKTSPSNASSPC